MRTFQDLAIYWDSSAVLSALLVDLHSNNALSWAKRPVPHLLSSLGYAEVVAVLGRMQQQSDWLEDQMDSAFKAFREGPWRYVEVSPTWSDLITLGQKWSLRGADLWHLTAFLELFRKLPELRLLTFDKKLREIAETEHIPVL